MKKKKNILVIRLSSMGDVALTIPVLQAVSTQNESIEITVLTKKAFQPLFDLVPNIKVISPDLKKKHKGFLGLVKLFLELRKVARYDIIIDLHDVLRSIILRNLFLISGTSFFKIDKGRTEKKKYTAPHHPEIKPLKHTTERYADVFQQANLNVDLIKYHSPTLTISKKIETFLLNKKRRLIGIAPFAAHATKQFPLDKMKKIITELNKSSYSILIFGGGNKEKNLAKNLEDTFENVFSVIGHFSLSEELSLIQQCQVMLTMDSSNMHLAGLVGTKVVSIWGSTHPYLGFSPFQETDESTMIQIPVEELPCRPCSVYGNKPCHRGDFACMNGITEEKVLSALLLLAE